MFNEYPIKSGEFKFQVVHLKRKGVKRKAYDFRTYHAAEIVLYHAAGATCTGNRPQIILTS